VTKDISFGVGTFKYKGEWGSGKCIEGDYKVQERFPDSDLGKNRKFKQTVKNFNDNDG